MNGVDNGSRLSQQHCTFLLSNDIEGHKKEAYIRSTGFIRELKSQKTEAMVFNKQNITLHGLHVHDGARF